MPDYDQVLEKSALRLYKLKANIHVWQIQQYIDDLRAKWKPKMKTLEGKPYTGPTPKEEPFDLLFWDEFQLKWTHKEMAFKGHVFNKVKELLNR